MKIIVPFKLHTTIDKLVNHFKDREFTLYGKSVIEGDDVIIKDIRIPKQKSSGCYTEVPEEYKELFINDLCDANEDLSAWNVWLHSHNTMSCSWSSTDLEDMWEFNKGNISHFVHLLVSTHGWAGAFTFYKPVKAIVKDVEIVKLENDGEEPENPEISGIISNKSILENRVDRLTENKERLEEEIKESKDVIKGLEEEITVLREIDSLYVTEKKAELELKNEKLDHLRESGGVINQGKKFFERYRHNKKFRKLLRRKEEGLQKEVDDLMVEVEEHELTCVCPRCLLLVRKRRELVEFKTNMYDMEHPEEYENPMSGYNYNDFDD